MTEKHALAAIADARSGPVPQGNAGAGLGAVSFGFKGGCGTASRIVHGGGGSGSGDGGRSGSGGGGTDGDSGNSYTIGTLVLANYGLPAEDSTRKSILSLENTYPSLLGVVATDAPLSPSSLNELAAIAAQSGKELEFRRAHIRYMYVFYIQVLKETRVEHR